MPPPAPAPRPQHHLRGRRSVSARRPSPSSAAMRPRPRARSRSRAVPSIGVARASLIARAESAQRRVKRRPFRTVSGGHSQRLAAAMVITRASGRSDNTASMRDAICAAVGPDTSALLLELPGQGQAPARGRGNRFAEFVEGPPGLLGRPYPDVSPLPPPGVGQGVQGEMVEEQAQAQAKGPSAAREGAEARDGVPWGWSAGSPRPPPPVLTPSPAFGRARRGLAPP